MTGDISSELIGAVNSVTKTWAKQRKAEERDKSAVSRRRQVMTYSRGETIKDVAWDVMERAYLKASANGSLPAHARQIMYAARPEIQKRTGKRLNDAYFMQTLLPDYMNELRWAVGAWDVVFDARGHFEEPHTNKIVPLGTLDVRGYLLGVDEHTGELPAYLLGADEIETDGIQLERTHVNRYGAVLFIEKEGFMPLFKRVNLAQRYDIAIMSTKGMSNTASRELVDSICSDDVPLLVLHDFDKAGFSIRSSLENSNRRYEFRSGFPVVDLGLRRALRPPVGRGHLRHVQPQIQPQRERRNRRRDRLPVQRRPPDVWLRQYHGRRVELNAFASDELVEWVEGKLEEHSIKKVVPDDDALTLAYRRALLAGRMNKEAEAALKRLRPEADAAEVPEDLSRQVRDLLDEDDQQPWDQAVASIAAKTIKDKS